LRWDGVDGLIGKQTNTTQTQQTNKHNKHTQTHQHIHKHTYTTGIQISSPFSAFNLLGRE